mgnify:CR=1 FL=1
MDPANPNYVIFKQEGEVKDQYENYEIAHFRMLGDSNFLPYGKSVIEPARRTWKQLQLMEDAMLIHRVMRAPEKRMFYIDIGNIPPNEVDNFMQKAINKMKKVPFVDEQTGDYNLKFNLQNMTEDFFMPVRGGDSGTRIENLGAMTYDGTEDIEYLKNKMMAALRIPKAFLGYEEGLSGGKATLAAEDVRFARTIERLQKIIVSELTKIGIVHLYSQGFEDADLIDFDLELQNPSMIHEQEKLELMNQQVELAEKAMETKLFSRKWIYDNIFDFSDEKKVNIYEGIVEDTKQKFRLDQIEAEGNDPAKQTAEPKPDDNEEDDGNEQPRSGDWGGSEKDPFHKDRPNDDKVQKRHRSFGKREFKGGSPLAQSKASTVVAREGIVNQLKKSFPKKNSSLLSEDNIIED